ncbi:right-handed parallel beta-helix repeat-containing protein [Prosthecobacter sp.]|uniref:protein kinase domain-containing protein n=1 Tax=Prosthecobacter sp. TaxID=1965333 RepID=UPI002AB90B81|nr:right-handed parallel beta-helix repeat-containing protein [Prosthecobacter sp.]MDZ4405006.1 protein kinase [Prosthecobacter sp.]
MSDNSSANLDDIEFGATMRGHQSGDLAFGRFALKRVLGRGGMGVVWLAEDTLLTREVALKFAPDTLRSDDAAIEELKGETRRGQDLAHPSIVKIFDFFLDEQHAAICMEYVDGDTLARLRVRQPNKVFEPRQVVRWVVQMLDGLSYAHRSAKIVHRDLKPPNLIINSQGDLKIMDFGIARSIQDSMARVTIAGNSTGTLAYMSPQQAAGRSASISDDIYSLGSTLYELFTGKPPFHSGDFSRQIREEIPPAICERRIEFGLTNTETFPSEWEDVILRCLEKQPELRPATVEDVRTLLGLGGGLHAPSLSPSAFGEPAVTNQQALVADTGMSATAISAAGKAVTVRANSALSPLTMGQPSAQRSAETTKPQAMSGPQTRKRPPTWLLAVAALGLVGAVVFMWPGKKISRSDSNKTAVVDDKHAVDQDKTPEPSDKPGMPPAKPALGLLVPDGYATIKLALAAAKAGDTIRIKPGRYEERVSLLDGVSLEAAGPGGEDVLISVNGTEGSALEAEKLKTLIKIKGLVFAHGEEGGGTAAVASILSSNVTFEDCVFESGLGDGVRVEGSSNVTFQGCTAQKNQGSGFYIARGAKVTMKGCKSISNGTDGLTLAGRATKAEVTGLEAMRNQSCGVSVQQGALLKAETLAARENVLNGLYVADAETRAEVTGGSLSRNGFVFTGGASKGTESGQGGGGLVAEAGPVVVVDGAEVEGNAKSGMQLMECATGSSVRNCIVTSNPYRGIMIIGVAGQEVLFEANKCLRGGQHGISVQGEGFRPKLLRNHCALNTQSGIFIYAGAVPVLEGNTFEGNGKEVETSTP